MSISRVLVLPNVPLAVPKIKADADDGADDGGDCNYDDDEEPEGDMDEGEEGMCLSAADEEAERELFGTQVSHPEQPLQHPSIYRPPASVHHQQQRHGDKFGASRKAEASYTLFSVLSVPRRSASTASAASTERATSSSSSSGSKGYPKKGDSSGFKGYNKGGNDSDHFKIAIARNPCAWPPKKKARCTYY